MSKSEKSSSESTEKDQPSKKRPSEDPKRSERPQSSNLLFYLVVFGVIALVGFTLMGDGRERKELDYSEFLVGLEPKSEIRGTGKFNETNIFELELGPDFLLFQDQPKPKTGETAKKGVKTKRYKIPVMGMEEHKDELIQLLNEKRISFTGATPPSELQSLALLLVVPLLFIVAIIYLFRKMGGTGSAMAFGRSRGRLIAQEEVEMTFDAVAGIDEAVEELREVVEFLRTPGKYQALGGRIPRGVLLVGPPGTGKTLLAKAVAGEAGVPFYSLSGSDFVEMFVGVGAARVRDMFQQAGQRSPSIIFIDELDALGKVRGSGMPGGHDEREQTLNALLVEMDGFESDQSVIVMAATNRPETLDPALLRPGRFDRHVMVDRPDILGREAILKVHAAKIKMGDNVDLNRLARLTPGFVGADLANLVNEAALLAARNNRTCVSMAEFEEGIERVMAGLEKQTRIIHEDERQRVAYHECGHALVACSLPHTDPIHKISIIPRGMAMGYAMQLPETDRKLITQVELQNRICVLLGGVTAEEIIYQETSTGAQNDLQRATDIARQMVTEFGMSKKLGRVYYSESARSPFLGFQSMPADRLYSEETIREIDLEVKRLVDEAARTAYEVLTNRRDVLEHMTRELIEDEVMDSDHLKRILDQYKTSPQISPGTSAAPSASEMDIRQNIDPKNTQNAADPPPPRESADGA
jgi:cell division protease FtsH